MIIKVSHTQHLLLFSGSLFCLPFGIVEAGHNSISVTFVLYSKISRIICCGLSCHFFPAIQCIFLGINVQAIFIFVFIFKRELFVSSGFGRRSARSCLRTFLKCASRRTKLFFSLNCKKNVRESIQVYISYLVVSKVFCAILRTLSIFAFSIPSPCLPVFL